MDAEKLKRLRKLEAHDNRSQELRIENSLAATQKMVAECQRGIDQILTAGIRPHPMPAGEFRFISNTAAEALERCTRLLGGVFACQECKLCDGVQSNVQDALSEAILECPGVIQDVDDFQAIRRGMKHLTTKSNISPGEKGGSM